MAPLFILIFWSCEWEGTSQKVGMMKASRAYMGDRYQYLPPSLFRFSQNDFQSTQCAKWQRVIDSWPMHIGCVMRPLFRLLFLVLHLFIGSVSRQRLCITVSRVNFLITLCSHLNVSCCFWSSLLNVDVNYRYILSFSCSGYLKCIEKYIVKYTYSDSC